MKRFSLRDLLFLVVVVALGLGWWLDKRPIPARFVLGGGGDHIYVLDTATGQVWEKSFTLSYSDGKPLGHSMTETNGFTAPKVIK
jgi:hypothetical protein